MHSYCNNKLYGLQQQVRLTDEYLMMILTTFQELIEKERLAKID